MSKIIIVNWKWANDCPKEYDSNTENKVVFLNYKKENDIDNTKHFYNKILEFIGKKEVLVCCHLNPPNNISSNDLITFDKNNPKLKEVIFHDFKGDGTITTPLYIGEPGSGLLHNDYQKFESYENQVLGGSTIPDSNFKSVWSIIPAEQKKKLINLWLPLAIDIQGLKDGNKKNLDKYFGEIKSDVIKEVNEDFLKSWDELKNSLSREVKGFCENDLPFRIVKSLKDENTIPKSFYNEYVEKIEQKNFLPNWLQEVVKVLDEKIGNSNPNRVKVNDDIGG